MPQETFLTAANPPAPLAERLRPQNLDEFAGQEHLIGKGKVLRRMIEGDLVSSMIFWGPPGVGKPHSRRLSPIKPRAISSTSPPSPAASRKSGR